MDIGYTFPLVDERTGRQFIGYAATLDGAVSDALRQLNEARMTEFRIVEYVRDFVEGAQ